MLALWLSVASVLPALASASARDTLSVFRNDIARAEQFQISIRSQSNNPLIRKLTREIQNMRGDRVVDDTSKSLSSLSASSVVSNEDPSGPYFEAIKGQYSTLRKERDRVLKLRLEDARAAISDRAITNWLENVIKDKTFLSIYRARCLLYVNKLIASGFGDLIPFINQLNMWDILQYALYKEEFESVAELHRHGASVDWMALAHYHQNILIPSQGVSSLFESIGLGVDALMQQINEVETDISVPIKVGLRTHNLKINSRMKIYQVMILINTRLRIGLRCQRGFKVNGKKFMRFTDPLYFYGVTEGSEIALTVRHQSRSHQLPMEERAAQLTREFENVGCFRPTMVLQDSHRLHSGFFGIHSDDCWEHLVGVLVQSGHFDLIERWLFDKVFIFENHDDGHHKYTGELSDGSLINLHDNFLTIGCFRFRQVEKNPYWSTLTPEIAQQEHDRSLASLRQMPKDMRLIVRFNGSVETFPVHSEMTLGDLQLLVKDHFAYAAKNFSVNGYAGVFRFYTRLFEYGFEDGDVLEWEVW